MSRLLAKTMFVVQLTRGLWESGWFVSERSFDQGHSAHTVQEDKQVVGVAMSKHHFVPKTLVSSVSAESK
jgi:hypothetical protein